MRANGLRDCWRFIKDKYFLCLHFIYDPELLLRNISAEELQDQSRIAEYLYQSDLCLGLLTKRGNASIKSMVKVYGCDHAYTQDPTFDLASFLHCPGATFQGINTLALLVRLELYVDEGRWKSLDRHTQSSLT